MFFAANGTRFVGSPSAGANGDVTTRELLDGSTLWFSGQSFRFADERRLHNVGLPLWKRFEPTVAGIAAGKDEVLDATVDLVRRE